MESLQDRIIRHEGLRLLPYTCTAGRLTIGVGRNIQDIGISKEEAYHMLDNDIDRVKQQLKTNLSWVLSLDEARKNVLIEMCFQLGINRLMTFKKMLNACRDGDYALASSEMTNSAWHTQTPKRCDELALIMLDGK